MRFFSESSFPGTDRTTIVRDGNVPWAIDVFENHLYWVSRETKTLYVQDKFGRGRVAILASDLEDVHAVRVSQRWDPRHLQPSAVYRKVYVIQICA